MEHSCSCTQEQVLLDSGAAVTITKRCPLDVQQQWVAITVLAWSVT